MRRKDLNQSDLVRGKILFRRHCIKGRVVQILAKCSFDEGGGCRQTARSRSSEIKLHHQIKLCVEITGAKRSTKVTRRREKKLSFNLLPENEFRWWCQITGANGYPYFFHTDCVINEGQNIYVLWNISKLQVVYLIYNKTDKLRNYTISTLSLRHLYNIWQSERFPSQVGLGDDKKWTYTTL